MTPAELKEYLKLKGKSPAKKESKAKPSNAAKHNVLTDPNEETDHQEAVGCIAIRKTQYAEYYPDKVRFRYCGKWWEVTVKEIEQP